MNPVIEFFLTRAVGRALRKLLTIVSGWLEIHGLMALKEPTIENLASLGAGAVGLGLSWAWSRWHDKLSFAKGAAGVESPAASACPKTQQVLQNLIVVFGVFALALTASAQTPVASAAAPVPPANAVTNAAQATAILQGSPIGSALEQAVSNLDPTSQFFATTKFDCRVGAVVRGKTAGAVTGFDMNFGRDWQACLDVVEGTTDNTIDAMSLKGGYRVLTLHNMEVTALIGVGYRWDDATMPIEGIGGLRVSYAFPGQDSVAVFTEVAEEWNSNRPQTQIVAGVMVRLPEPK